jgi:hypothetical protein
LQGKAVQPPLRIVLGGPPQPQSCEPAVAKRREVTLVDGPKLKISLLVAADGNYLAEDLPQLRPKRPGRESDWLLKSLSVAPPEDLVPRPVSPADATALRAGLFQVYDYLDESHRDSQSVEGDGRHRCGDYWHAIMHRREPDYTNAKYWFRRVGRHPILASLGERAVSILDQCPSADAARWKVRLHAPCDWDPCAFVDLCEHCAAGTDDPLDSAARRIQWEEMVLLLAATYNDAAGSS